MGAPFTHGQSDEVLKAADEVLSPYVTTDGKVEFRISAHIVTGAKVSHSRPADREKVLEFATMVGVSGPFKGTANPINGVNGGGLAWTIAVARGKLRADGELTITVRGLVFAEGPNAGSNTLPGFRGLVSCRTIDGTGAPATSNVSTDVFPATEAGDADIRVILELADPCIAPIVFVTSPTGAWFAATGF